MLHKILLNTDYRVFGEKKYSMRLWLDPDKMSAGNITSVDVKHAVARQFPEIDFLAGVTYYKNETAVGAISSLQLREIQKNLLNARLRLLTARFEAKTRETALMLLSGKLVLSYN